MVNNDSSELFEHAQPVLEPRSNDQRHLARLHQWHVSDICFHKLLPPFRKCSATIYLGVGRRWQIVYGNICQCLASDDCAQSDSDTVLVSQGDD